ncbi:protein rigor mortis isoform X1 [Anopheles coustani]|uniref:protein rigor mortis isoform X1 n=1 Tax=Anopheles coustani TaxID=139045 RepID=UPI00265B300B|nr:protein rigor mortis isoform X1 [Anopheles coustani]
MDGFVLPTVPVWFHQDASVATPDNGLLYYSRFDVMYIPPVEKDRLPRISVLTNDLQIASLACDLDWSERRLFATLDESKSVYIWDLDLQQPVQGHRGHVGPKSTAQYHTKRSKETALCFAENKKLLSCDHSQLIVYCLLSDTYTVHANLFRPKSIVVTLVPSPVDRDVFLAGMKDGVIQMFSIKKMTVLHTLRAHDKEIISIACMMVPVMNENRPISKKGNAANKSTTVTDSVQKAGQARPKKQARKKAVPEADASDFFDIYDFNENQEEFGTIIDRESQNKQDQFREKTKTVEGFNFLEACENLKEDILKAATKRDDEDQEDDDEEGGDRSHIHQEEFNTDDENELDDCEKLRDYVVIDNDDDRSEGNEDVQSGVSEEDGYETKLIIVSASREVYLWFWDYDTGLPIDKIVMPFSHNDCICNAHFSTAIWLNEQRVVAHNGNGNVLEWKVNFSFKNNTIRLASEMSLAPYPVGKVISLTLVKQAVKGGSECSESKFLWCNSINRKLVCLEVSPSGKPTVVLDYSCVLSVNNCIVENPLESMVIAMGSAAPRIETLNLASIQYDSIPIKPITNKICGPITSLDWHPEDEQKLAFGTNEGRIGVIDTGSGSNVPVILKPFTNRTIYALKWCYLTDSNKQRRLVLFASGKSELAYYHVTGSNKNEPVMCKQFDEVSYVSAKNNLCFVGTQNGTVYINDLDNNMQQIYKRKITKRYVSALEYKLNWLAVGSNDHNISLINFTDGGIVDNDGKNITLLEGHDDGICKLRWSRGESMLLVSCSFDTTIRVWNAPAGTCLSVFRPGYFIYGAMFSPLDENIILYVGKGCSLSFFDYTKPQNDFTKGRKKPFKCSARKVQENDTKKSNKKVTKTPTILPQSAEQLSNEETVEKLTDGLKKVSLQEKHPLPFRTNVVTTFQLAYREVNRPQEVLECIVKLLHTIEPEPEPEPDLNTDDISTDNDDDVPELREFKTLKIEKKETEDAKQEADNGKVFYNEKLFTTEEKLKQLIQEEVNNHQTSATSSIGMVILPQLLHKLKEVIVEHVSKKKLTPQLLALAPYVSHMFWRQCCQAYAYQLIESQQSLAAIPYFLASHKVDESIEALCDAKYYREAWAICRLQKMPDDPTLEKVATEWANHLDACGNLEAAALVWTGVKKYQKAIDALSKRREISDDLQRTIDELALKLQEVASD